MLSVGKQDSSKEPKEIPEGIEDHTLGAYINADRRKIYEALISNSTTYLYFTGMKIEFHISPSFILTPIIDQKVSISVGSWLRFLGQRPV